jgi:hypothetical protein
MYRLIYKSRSSVTIDRGIVRDILHASLDRNREADVTGALLATSTHFLQVLEGDFDEVNETFQRIARDTRHSQLKLVSFGPEEKRLFEGWAMRGFGIFDLNRELEAQLKEKYGEEEGGVRFPTDEWAALALTRDVSMMGGEAITG